MNNKLEEQVIYPKDLLFAALYRWKAAVVLGLVLALLLGGLQVLKSSGSGVADTAAQAAYEEALLEFEEEKASLDAYKEKYEAEIHAQTQYLQDSVLLSLDPFAHYRATVSLYASTDYQIQADKFYQTPDKVKNLLANYQALLQSDSTVTALAESAGLAWQQMYELYTVNCNTDTGVLTVTILHSDKTAAENLLKCLLEIADKHQAVLAQGVGKHELAVLHQGVELVSDVSLLSVSREAWAQLNTLKEELTKIQDAIGALVAPAPPLVGGFSVKKTVIFAVLGFIAGFAVVAVAAWFTHMESDKVYSARLLRIRTGIKVLGTLNVTKFGPLDRMIRKWEGRDIADPAAKAALLACDLRNRFPEGTILLTGSGTAQDREALLQALLAVGADAVDAGNLLTDAQAVEALKKASGVVLAEKCAQATCTDVFQQMQTVADYQKPLLGCVVLDG